MEVNQASVIESSDGDIKNWWQVLFQKIRSQWQ